MDGSTARHDLLMATILVTPGQESVRQAAAESDFERLMRQLADGSEEAAWEIAVRYTPHILRVVRRSLPQKMRSKVDSQDFAQIVWASLLLKRTYLRHVKTSAQLVDLLAKVAKYKVVDAYRHYVVAESRDVRKEYPLDFVPGQAEQRTEGDLGTGRRRPAKHRLEDPSLSPSQIVGTREKLQKLLDGLSPRDRKILKMRIEGGTYSEIGSALSVSSDIARRVLNRIIAQLSI